MYSQVISTVAVLFLFTLLPQSLSLSLYSADDPLHELDYSNFQSVVFQKNNAWIIEFYSNWCGHCIRFAPTWKLFARDIRTWRSVDVGVVNCADPKNSKLCREYDINAFPTVKVFKSFVNETEKGDPLAPGTDIEAMASSLTKYLESYQDQNAPGDWPDLHPLALNSVRSITNLLKNNEGSLILFIEHSDSFIGRKVIMDLSFQTSVVIRRVLATNEDLLNDLDTEMNNSSLATVLKIDKSGNIDLLFRFPADANSTYIRDQMFLHVVGSPRSEINNVLGSKTNMGIKVSIRDSVHMADLENALRYLLYQEMGIIKNIYGDRLHALKSFLQTLKNYFPGQPPIMGYLSNLNDWVAPQMNITGEEFVHKLDKLKTSDEYLPEMKDFVSCKGSEPRYRGYPCSLWTLFHTLTVQAYIKDEETAGGMKENIMAVLPNIKGYIRYFFTCEECVQNFFKMDQVVERDASTSPNAVLWLWSAHNRVNHRLSGDITEDPHHPKIQFPSPSMCPSCRLENEESGAIKWDEVQVLRFLKHFYGSQNIVASDSFNEVNPHGSYSSGNSKMALKFNLYLFVNLLLWIYRYKIQKMDSY